MPKALYATWGVMIREGARGNDVQAFGGAICASSEDEARGIALRQMQARHPAHMLAGVWLAKVPTDMLRDVLEAEAPHA